jgi:soluble lytic murein transglycosylase-like protein
VFDDVIDFVLDFIFCDDPPFEDAMSNNTLSIRDQKIVKLIVEDIIKTNPKINMQTAIQWSEKIIYEAQKYDINPFLIASQANLESTWNPNAKGAANDIGLLQVVDKTGREIAKKLGYKHFSPEMLKDPMTNIEFSAYYLDYCYDQTKKYIKNDTANHDWLALASYNRGVIPAVKTYISGKLGKVDYVNHVRKRFMDNYNGIGVIFDY